MTDGYTASSPGAIWSFNQDEFYPLPSLQEDNTPSLLLGDTTLYNIANFFRQLLNSNLLPRFADDMLASGVKSASLPSYQDGYAVAQVVTYPLYPHLLLTTAFKFPLLSVVQTGMQSVMLTSTKTAIKRDFNVSWVMPPLSSAQALVYQAYQSIAAKAWMAYGGIGYDPKLSTTSIWVQTGIAFATIGQVSLLPFKGQQPVDKGWSELPFPAVTLSLSVWEYNQLGLPQNAPVPFTSASVEIDLADGYNPANPLPNVADGYIFPTLSVSNISPNSGSIQGDTLLYVIGNGFNVNQTYQVSLAGAIARKVTVRSPILMQVLSNPGIQTGPGDIVITDTFGNSYTIPNGWSYT